MNSGLETGSSSWYWCRRWCDSGWLDPWVFHTHPLPRDHVIFLRHRSRNLAVHLCSFGRPDPPHLFPVQRRLAGCTTGHTQQYTPSCRFVRSETVQSVHQGGPAPPRSPVSFHRRFCDVVHHCFLDQILNEYNTLQRTILIPLYRRRTKSMANLLFDSRQDLSILDGETHGEGKVIDSVSSAVTTV